MSYGWAGNDRADEGDRRWVAKFAEVLNEKLRTALGTKLSIFLDQNTDKAGYLKQQLAKALDSSALLLFVVSPGSCRANSWCHLEAGRFWDRAKSLVSSEKLVMAPEDRIFKVVMSPVPPQSEPQPLQPVAGRDLYTNPHGSVAPVAIPADWTNPGAELETSLALLADELARTLKQSAQIESRAVPASGKCVFLGASSEPNRERLRRLRRELLLEGHEVRFVSPLSLESETDFLLRTEECLHDATLAVFAIAEPWDAPAGWAANPAAVQVEAAFRKSAGNDGFSVYVWEDPHASARDQQCLARISPSSKDQHIRGNQAFEYLESNVRARLRELVRSRGPDPPRDTNAKKTICLEYRETDAHVAFQIRDALCQKGIQVQLAIPTPERGQLLNRIIKKNQVRYYADADGLVVFFGEGDYEWVSDVCYAMKKFVRPGKGVVVLGPPRERPPGKEGFEQPGFLTMKCFASAVDSEFEDWAEHLEGGKP